MTMRAHTLPRHVVWWCGGVVVWWCGGVVVWWCGGVVVWGRWGRWGGVVVVVVLAVCINEISVDNAGGVPRWGGP